ncbi:hypothetical protein [Ruegeria sp. HKCCD8929]|uniref:hypothetical protein n=1 Tax=Ruegeria sp. HKCCD8929 TaxID=2683006 RepID=UPI0014895BF2|nr:hypothetical protein [Ruegeria sp. HKCCD8929]
MESEKTAIGNDVLEERIRGIERGIDRASQRDSRFTTAISWSSGIVVAAFVGLQVYSAFTLDEKANRIEERANTTLQDAETKIRKLTERLGISGSDVGNLVGDGTNYLNGTVHYYKGENESDNPYEVYSLAVSISFQVTVKGDEPGKLLGYEIRFTEELPNVLREGSANADAEELYKNRMLRPDYYNMGSEGILLAPEIPIELSYSINRNRLSCSDIEKMHDNLIGMRTAGKVFVKPIFENHDNSSAKEEEFHLRFYTNTIYDCNTLEQLPAVDVAEN